MAAIAYYFLGSFVLSALLLVPALICVAFCNQYDDALVFIGGTGLLCVGGENEPGDESGDV